MIRTGQMSVVMVCAGRGFCSNGSVLVLLDPRSPREMAFRNGVFTNCRDIVGHDRDMVHAIFFRGACLDVLRAICCIRFSSRVILHWVCYMGSRF